jgi:hypothetical protein
MHVQIMAVLPHTKPPICPAHTMHQPRHRRQHSTAQHSTAQHSTAQHSTTQHNTTQHNTTQHNTTQHNTTQHNTTQHNTTQHTECVAAAAAAGRLQAEQAFSEEDPLGSSLQLWPDEAQLPGFRATMRAYFTALWHLHRRLNHLLALALKVTCGELAGTARCRSSRSALAGWLAGCLLAYHTLRQCVSSKVWAAGCSAAMSAAPSQPHMAPPTAARRSPLSRP